MDNKVTLDGQAYWASAVVRDVAVRPVAPSEIGRWKSLIQQHHYLGLDHLVGETILHVAEVDGHWVALLGWCSAALKVTARDQYIGWSPQQKQRRLKLVAQNGRFLLLVDPHAVPNLASRVLAMSVRRLAEDWRAVHGHPVVLAETFVDPARFPGTCYRAAGWECIGQTQGYGKHAMRYAEHGEPKQVLVRELFRGARGWLREPFDRPELMQQPGVDLNRVPLGGQDGLLATLAQVPDRRKRRGIRHSQVSILAVAVCAVLTGSRTYRAMAEYGAGLSGEVLLRLGFRPSPSTGKLRSPSEPTIRRVLSRIDADELDRRVGAFLSRIGLAEAVAFDGKTLRGSGQGKQRPQHLMAVVTHKTPVVLAQRAVGDKTNEIPEAHRLLEPLDLRGKVVTADAMHAQKELARFIVEQKGADYLFTVKENQPMMHKLLAAQDWALSPPVHGDR
jgi:hypothetical protein